MIIVMQPGSSEESIKNISKIIESNGLQTHISKGTEVTIIGVVGDKSRLKGLNLEIEPEVEKIVPITESYKLTNKKFHPTPSTIKVGNTTIGPDTFTIIGRPLCN